MAQTTDDRLERIEEKLDGISAGLTEFATVLRLHCERVGERDIHHTPPCGWSDEHLAAHEKAAAARDRRRNWRFALIGALAAVVGAITGVAGTAVAWFTLVQN